MDVWLLCLRAAWIVSRIDVSYLEWAHQVHLNCGPCFRPGEVIHVCRRDGKAARREVMTVGLVKLAGSGLYRKWPLYRLVRKFLPCDRSLVHEAAFGDGENSHAFVIAALGLRILHAAARA